MVVVVVVVVVAVVVVVVKDNKFRHISVIIKLKLNQNSKLFTEEYFLDHFF